ncbi:MAG: hypothetical protein DI630_00970 [Gordonia sp. (in: high G+C Gram-positive bacteria)]|nr:MAG: hypothetical protein DI630_00970 [Gordonia sp. (in: high G+C Gram-positive bacteria)]
MTVTTIERGELTLLVLPTEQAQRAGLLHAYPIDLGQSADEISAELDAVSDLEGITRKQLVIAGLEFEDPEQHNTNVTVGSSDLDGVTWVLGDGGMVLTSAKGVLGVLDHLASIEVPVYA